MILLGSRPFWKSAGLLIVLSLAGNVLAMPPEKSYLSICHTESLPDSARKLAFTDIATGQRHTLALSETRPEVPACQSLELPVPLSEVVWAKPLSVEEAQSFQQGVILSSLQEQGATEFEAIPLVDPPPVKEQPLPTRSPSTTKASAPILSTWIWQPALWMPEHQEALWHQLQDAYINRIYISIPLDETTWQPQNRDNLRQFIRTAKSKKLSVWAVEGDPYAILPEGRQHFAQRAAAYTAYNQAVPVEEKLDGVQYDIEPYLIPGFHLNPAAGYKAYLETMKTLKAHLNIPVESVLPFWIAEGNKDRRKFMEKLGGIVDGLAVMDYRTNPTQIKKLAEPFLNWGERFDKPVQIALEAGPLPNEYHRVYHPAQTGEVWIQNLQNQPMLIVLKQAHKNPKGLSFAYSHQTLAQSDATTFNANIRALIQLLPALQTYFSNWPSYQGLALHQYLEISRNPPKY